MYKQIAVIVWVLLALLCVQPSNQSEASFSQTKKFQDACTKPQLVQYTFADYKKHLANRSETLLIREAASALMIHEGFSAVAYRDSDGKWTQGYGRHGIKPVKNLTEAQAKVWLYEDIETVIQELDDRIPWWRTCNSVRQQVLINVAYNVGVPRLVKFETFLKATSTRQYTKASKAILYTAGGKSRYWKQVGVRAEDLAYAMKHGKWDAEFMKQGSS